MSYGLFGGGFLAAPPSTGYDNASLENQAYRLRVALDRDGRLNYEEAQVRDDVIREIELGPRWWLRAHP